MDDVYLDELVGTVSIASMVRNIIDGDVIDATIDATLSTTSENPVQNKVITAKINEITEAINDITDASHTHDNKDILDSTTASYTAEEKGKLANLENYDDTALSERLTEIENNYITKDSLTIDDSLNSESTNPVQNQAVSSAIDELNSRITTIEENETSEDDCDCGVKVVESTDTTLPPDEYRVYGEVSELSITLESVDDDELHEYCFEFIPSEGFTGLTITPEIKWAGSTTITTGKTHQVSIVRGIGVMLSA